jgi:uncharacterized protein (DUF2147 family)
MISTPSRTRVVAPRLQLLALAALLAGPAWADQDAVLGIWSGGDSLVEVTAGAESLSMKVLALRDAVYQPDEGLGEPGSPRLDDNNPDPALKERPLVGLELLSEYRWTGKRWEGKIYDPGTGNTYSSRMELDGNRLKMRGYIGMPMLGRTQFFEPVETCEPAVAEMVTVSQVDLEYCD